MSEKGGRKPQISLEIVSFIVWLKTLCGWGAIRIAAERANQGQRSAGADFSPDGSSNFSQVSSTDEDLSPFGQVARFRYCRSRKRAPNEMWHVEKAGPFQSVSQKVSLLVVVDDDSRFALAIEVIPSQETTTVTGILERLFSQYGTPKEILTDNGTTFASVWTTGTHQFDEESDSHDVSHK